MKEEALKLADELEEFYVDPDGFPYMIHESAAMIRRLVEELDKQGKPVAWIIQSKYGTPQLNLDARYRFRYDSTVVKQASIPLYTTPQTKPLSVDERKQLFYKHTTSPTGMMFETMNITEFFKAIEEIEERHGIK